MPTDPIHAHPLLIADVTSSPDHGPFSEPEYFLCINTELKQANQLIRIETC